MPLRYPPGGPDASAGTGCEAPGSGPHPAPRVAKTPPRALFPPLHPRFATRGLERLGGGRNKAPGGVCATRGEGRVESSHPGARGGDPGRLLLRPPHRPAALDGRLVLAADWLLVGAVRVHDVDRAVL